MEDSFPDLGSLSDAELKELIREAHGGGGEGLLHAAHPARQDRHPARRARQPPAQEARGGRGRDHAAPTSSSSPTSWRAGAGRRRPGDGRPELSGPVAWRRGGASAALPRVRVHQQRRGQLLPEVRRPPARRRAGGRPDHDHLQGRRDRRADSRSTSRRSAGRGWRARDPLRRRAGRGRASRIEGERMTIGRSPDANVFLDDVTVSRNHALLVRRRDGLYIDDLGLAERHLREPAPDRVTQAPERRRAAGRQVQADLPGALSRQWSRATRSAQRPHRAARFGDGRLRRARARR